MTVTQMQTYVSQLLADTSNQKWKDSTHILPALNNSQYEFVLRLLGYAVQNRSVFELLGEIEAKTAVISIPSTGYVLGGLDATAPYMRNGFIALECTIDGETVYPEHITAPDIKQQQNYYLKGNDDKPKCYVFNEKLYVLVSVGSYPVSAVLYYIREPKILNATSTASYQATTCELNRMFHYLICEMANAKCLRMLGDESSLRKYDNLIKRINNEIQAIAIGGMVAPETKETV